MSERSSSLISIMNQAVAYRESDLSEPHQGAYRLLNGFLEGIPELSIDLYGRTLVFHLYSNPPEKGADLVESAVDFFKERFPWLRAIVLKERYAEKMAERSGRLIFGDAPDRRVLENGVWYAVDLLMNRDASLYLDTRLLRHWIQGHFKGKTVLNTFAYTGSLGVAAHAAGATRVVQLERTRKFLNIAKESYSLNGYKIDKEDFLEGDFWMKVSYLKKRGIRFDGVILDPPFFAASESGRVDLEENCTRLINKVRPLLNDGGVLIVINNALFLSGVDFMKEIERLCEDGYLKILERIEIPPDFAGYPGESLLPPVTDPAPFNHSTKIVVLEVKRKK